MKKEYTWEIIAKNTPLIKKKCSHCNCNRFYCSEKFRMNSQKKNVDVWLIYRCLECDSTYNVNIFSRVKSTLLKNRELFQKFSDNDTQMSWKYAFSSEMGRKNNIEIDYSNVEYEILHDNISLVDIANHESEIIIFKIKCQYEFNLRLTHVIRRCLNLSASQLNYLLESKSIYSSNIQLINNHRVKNGDVIQIDKEKLYMLKI
ncbi:DUF1062 domain-containing protein [Dysgonomonas massiliensis]|uniref:DUF1062 domain-containing protein n=1 Tax=Dysgonomonas massiliensis TaxID=2040292 RepID=UPI000C786A44|nr:DUF1062 domain-containing protein [Dysgonomonas massiliensis]